jgi:hypothetical protein
VPKLKVVFPRPLFEHQLIFCTDNVALLPKFFGVLEVVDDFVQAAKEAGKSQNE